MSKFAKVIQTAKGEGKPERVRGKSRREDYVGLKVYIPKELYRKLKLRAAKDDNEMSEVVERALAFWLENQQSDLTSI